MHAASAQVIAMWDHGTKGVICALDELDGWIEYTIKGKFFLVLLVVKFWKYNIFV